MPIGFDGLPPSYIGKGSPLTPNLGLSVFGMDPVLAENMFLIDAAVGSGGTSVFVNSVSVANPNFNDSTPSPSTGNVNVVWSVSGSNVSAAVTPGIISINGTQISALPANFQSGSGISVADTGAGDVVISFTGTLPADTPAISHEFLNSYSASTGVFGQRSLQSGDIPSGTVLWNQIGNATGALILANAGNATTFNQTSAVTWTWANTTAATSGTSQPSPILSINGQYWTGAASATDSWTIQNVVANGTNGEITLTIGHSGSTALPLISSAGTIQVPNGTVSQPAYAWTSEPSSGWYMISGGYYGFASNAALALTIGSAVSGPGFQLQLGAASQYNFTNTNNPSSGSADTGISRLGAAAVAIGNGTPGDFSGTLKTTIINAVTGYQINGAATSGNYLRGNGTNFVSSAIQSGDIPSGTVLWNQIGNPNGNLTLSMAGNTTTFNQTSAVNWTWANTTAATSGTSQSSPILNINGTYWTGAASATDSWTIQAVETNGTNGASTLTFAHSGSSGTANISIPAGITLADGTVINNASTAGPGVHIWARGDMRMQRGGGNTTDLIVDDGTGACVFLQAAGASNSGTGMLCFASTSNAGDSGVSRIGAASLAVGNGTTGDTTGNLSFGKVIKYNGTSTVSAGVPSEIVTVDLTAQSAAIAATNLTASAPQTGMYRIAWAATITTASDISSVLGGTNGFQIVYTSPTDSVVKTTVSGNSVTSAANTTGTAVGDDIVIYAKTGTAIQYKYDYTDSHTSTAMAFELHIKLEAM